VHLKAGATHIDRAALKIRAALMTSRNAFANQLRGQLRRMLKLFGLPMARVTTPNKRRERLDALLSKAGDPMPRSALYEAANNLPVRVKRPFALQTWGRKLAETKGPKRARIAVARKRAALLLRIASR
jgi:hypothetical protein